MEYTYSAYTKLINDQTHYFVKKYVLFPELKGVGPVLVNYGMHTDFLKACSIASIYDNAIRQQLYKEAQATVQQAKLIDFNAVKFSRKIFKR
jgi:hypothetical protein